MRKLSISRAWEETRAVLAHDGKLIGTVALALLVVPGLIVEVVMPAAPRGEMPAPGIWVAVGLAGFLVTLAGQLSIVRLAMGPPISVGEAIVHGARRTLPLVGAFLIWALPLVLAISTLYAVVRADPAHPSGPAALLMLALSLLGIFLAIRLLLVGPVASAEAVGPIAILKRSWEITSGNWWRLFGFIMLFFIAALVFLYATTSVLGLLAKMFLGGVEPLSAGWLVVILVSQVLTALLYTVLFVMQARLYVQRAAGDETGSGIPISGT
jgi:hypothetical protein